MTMNLYANNASDTLNGAITNVATTVILNDASEFDAIGAGEQYYITVADGTNIEIMLATALSTNTFTVTRGQQGTSGTAFADGSLVEQRITAGDLDNFVQMAETGDIDFSGASSMKIPSDAAPTVDAEGKFALDNTITDYTGMTKYHDGTEELTHIACPTANLSTTDGHAIRYNATNNELEMVMPGCINVQVYSSGSGTYTVPSGVTRIFVEVIGGGGSGGATLGSGSTFAVGGGGGAGGYARSFIASPAASYAYAVGAGGAAPAAGLNNGNTGGNTTVGSITGNGGLGGNGSAGVASTVTAFTLGGAGGTASSGDINVSGVGGAFGISSSGNLGSGSGGAGNYGGGAAAIANGTGNGNAGSTGGGGSGSSSSTVSFAGGAGGDGVILIWEFQ